MHEYSEVSVRVCLSASLMSEFIWIMFSSQKVKQSKRQWKNKQTWSFIADFSFTTLQQKFHKLSDK